MTTQHDTPNPAHLLSIADLANLLDTTPGAIRTRKWRHHLPPPDGTIGNSPYWRRDTITTYLERNTPHNDHHRTNRAPGNSPPRTEQ